MERNRVKEMGRQGVRDDAHDMPRQKRLEWQKENTEWPGES